MLAKPALIVLILSFSYIHPLGAQDRLEETPPVFSITFRTLALEKGEYAGVYIQSNTEEEPSPVFFNRYRRSGLVSYTGSSPLVFFRLEEAENPELPPRKIPVAAFKITASTPKEDLLLLTRPNPSSEPNQPEFLISGMDDSREAFPQNSVLFINLTSVDLLGTVNKKRAEFPIGVSDPFPLTSSVKISIIHANQKDVHFLFENSFEFQKDSRVILVLQPPKKQNSLRIRCRHIIENAEPEPTPSPSPED